MAKRDTIVIRVKKAFVEQCLDPLVETERKRGRINTGYSDASEMLRLKILKAGGLRL